MTAAPKSDANPAKSRPADGISVPVSSVPLAVGEVQRQMVHLAFKDTLRQFGVPPEWIGCEVHLIAGVKQLPNVQIHLIYKRWSGQLLRYSMALQQQILVCLGRYEPGVDHSTYEWVWRYARECDCPFPTLPPAEEWKKKLEAKKPPKSVDLFERRKTPRTAKVVAAINPT